MKRTMLGWLAASAAMACLILTAPARADTFPSRPVKLVVPYSPGGLPDTVARSLSRPLGEALGQSVFVENKPGAGGAGAASTLTPSPADVADLLIQRDQRAQVSIPGVEFLQWAGFAGQCLGRKTAPAEHAHDFFQRGRGKVGAVFTRRQCMQRTF